MNPIALEIAMSSPITATARDPRLGSERPTNRRATLAVISRPAADPAHRELTVSLPECSVRRWSSADADAVLDELSHRDMVRFALRGGVIGGVVFGALTFAVAVAAGQGAGVGAGLGAAVALTGGIFFGSLMGFFAAALRWEDAHAGLRTDGHGHDETGILLVEGAADRGAVRRILHSHGAIAVNTSPS